MSRAIDAKIITMIDDLSHAALIDVLSNPITEAEKPYLASAIKQMYEAGLLDGADIVEAWEGDSDEQT